MKRVLFVVALVASTVTGGAVFAQDYVDIVHLKNGSVIRGLIIEQVPGESLKIQTADGSVFVYPIDEVAKMTKEQVEAEAASAPTGPRKSPGAALGWSLGIGVVGLEGAGQFYNGEIGKGFGYMIWGLVGSALFYGGIEDNIGDWDPDEDDGVAVIGLLSKMASITVAALDSYRSANRINRERGWATVSEAPRNQLHLSANPVRRGRGGMLAFTHRM